MGVEVLDRRQNVSYELRAPIVISSIGQVGTSKLLGKVEPPAPPPAIGLKVQILSPRSLIDHDGILFCLDTQRIAGILQATNIDPSLAPPGKHLLISHQVIQPGADWQAERDLALDDWRFLFGAAFDDCEIVGVGHFPAAFPVNWAAQGLDRRDQPFAERGLWLIGDGFKPSGLIMVEGAAASAEQVVRQLLGQPETQPWLIAPGEQAREWLRRIGAGIKGQ